MELSLLTGSNPIFSETLHVGRPNVVDEGKFLDKVSEIIKRRWLSNNGPVVQAFEKEIASFLNVKNCICVCNATIGLEIAIRAAELTGEVIVPSYTFIATVHALQWQGIRPVFADISSDTHNIDPVDVEKRITEKTTAILATHLWGRPCDVRRLREVAERYNLKLLFDAAHSFGCSYEGKKIGALGHAEVFSFHATKFLNSFEGGAITTDDDALAAKIRLITNFGFSGYDNVIHLGTNGKMTEVCAAMGVTNLDNIQILVQRNINNYRLYRKGLSGIEGIKLIEYNETETPNYQYIVLEVDEAKYGISRDYLVRVLHRENVLARKYFWPGCHNMEPYRSLYPGSSRNLKNTEHVADRVIVLPTGTGVTEDQIITICQIIQTAAECASEVRKCLNNARYTSVKGA